MKKNVWLCQVNNSFGKAKFLPYSVGMLQAYCRKDRAVSESYDFRGFVYHRENVAECVKRIGKVDVLGISVYIWNSSWSLAFAKAVKQANPSCLVVVGGPHVPVRCELFFKENLFVDVAVFYEGEVTFKEALLVHLNERPDLAKVPGLAFRLEGEVVKTPNRERLSNLDLLPSPYLEGTFDELLREVVEPLSTWEGNRGCPFSCTIVRPAR